MSSGQLVGAQLTLLPRVDLALCVTEEDISLDILHVWLWIIT